MRRIIGVDESGTGAWAGPFTVAAVAGIEEELAKVPGLGDSKKISDRRRREMIPQIAEFLHGSFVSVCPIWDIDKSHHGAWVKGVATAVHNTEAMLRTLELNPEDYEIIVDGSVSKPLLAALTPKQAQRTKFEAKADGKYKTVGAASIFAKTLRNDIMVGLSALFPKYGWEGNSGYGTAAHRRSIQTYGLTEHHRDIKYNLETSE